jgi:hypothetical protein
MRQAGLDIGIGHRRLAPPGPTIRPLWFLALGFVLVLTALFIWWQAYP